MPWIETNTITPMSIEGYSDHDVLQIYNGLDCCLTAEVYVELSEQLRRINEPGPQLVYNFKRAMQGPALDMMLRGIRVDAKRKSELLDELIAKQAMLEGRLEQLTLAMVGGTFNPRSPVAWQPFFYELLGIPPISVRMKGVTKTPMNLEVLEKLCEFKYAKPVAKLILAIRGLGKQIGVLRTGVDPDGRMRTSYNVASTETERWSSSENAFGTGTNLQNITEELREIFIADPGCKLAYVDLSQAESFIVGLAIFRCSGDDAYLRACESGDLHTGVAKMAWTELGWTGNKSADRALADILFYRWFSYRDISKRLGHATNYRGSAFQLARILRIEQRIVEDFQRRYKAAFNIDKWHLDVAQKLQLEGQVTTLFGNRRQFFGRLYDEATLREAIAYEPQSVVGQLLNLIMYRVWKASMLNQIPVQLLAQVHDAILIQYPEESEAQTLAAVNELFKVPLSVSYNGNRRTTLIPNEAAVGWNWGKPKYNKQGEVIANFDGLEKWAGHDPRKRTGNPKAGLLDRSVRGIHGRPANT